MSQFASGKNALGVCDRCGFQYKLLELRPLTVNRNVTNLLVCDECWEPDHPQNELGRYPVRDPQAIRNPRPDYAEYAESRANIVPVAPIKSRGRVGTVTVTIT